MRALAGNISAETGPDVIAQYVISQPIMFPALNSTGSRPLLLFPQSGIRLENRKRARNCSLESVRMMPHARVFFKLSFTEATAADVRQMRSPAGFRWNESSVARKAAGRVLVYPEVCTCQPTYVPRTIICRSELCLLNSPPLESNLWRGYCYRIRR